MANVQISEELFLNLYKFFNLDNFNPDIYNICKDGINVKMQKIHNRQLYTQYKAGDTEQIKEQARQAYLDNKQIKNDWRW